MWRITYTHEPLNKQRKTGCIPAPNLNPSMEAVRVQGHSAPAALQQMATFCSEEWTEALSTHENADAVPVFFSVSADEHCGQTGSVEEDEDMLRADALECPRGLSMDQPKT